MAPESKTSLVVEIPCQKGDPIWSKDENNLTKDILSELLNLSFFKEEELIPFIGISFIVFKNLSRFVGAVALFNDYILGKDYYTILSKFIICYIAVISSECYSCTELQNSTLDKHGWKAGP